MLKFENNPESTQNYEIDIVKEQWTNEVAFQIVSTNTKRTLKGTCRCCLAKGTFENMERKTKEDPSLSYMDIVRTVFGINLIYARDTRLICSACAIRLRQALSFRKQIVAAETLFAAQHPEFCLPVTQKIQIPQEKVVVEKGLEELASLDFTEPELEVKAEPSEHSFDDCTMDATSEAPRAPPKFKHVKLFACQNCHVKFKTEEKREEHNITKHLTCLPCKRICSTVEERDRHRELHPVQCPVCDEIFDTTKEKRAHIKKVHGSVCSLCKERVKESMRNEHRVKVHGKPSLQCGICERMCKGVTEFHLHQRKSHMKEKNVQCSQCDFKSFDLFELKRHMVSHGTDKKLTCDYCNKKFSRKSSLRYHVMIHSGLRPKVCKFCGEAFVQRASLKYHLEKRHPGNYY